MNKLIILGLAVSGLALMPHTSHATNPGNNGGNGGCGVGQTTNGCGGAGGNATQGQIQGQGQVQSLRNQLYNKNENTNNNAPQGGAGGGGGLGGGGGAGGNSSARGGDQSQGQSTSVSNVGNTTYPAVASSATAPSFAIGGCQWAIAGGFQALGFGLSGGGAGMYEFCKPLMKAKHFYEIGKPNVAKNLECNYSEFKEAYRMAGEPCRNDMSKAEIAAADAQATVALNTPTPVAIASRRAEFPRGEAGTVQCLNTYGVKACN